MESSYHFPANWKDAPGSVLRPLSITSLESVTENSSPGSDTPSLVDISRGSSFSPPSTSEWPLFTPSSTGDTSPMTTETVLSISHYKFPPSSSGSLVEVDPDLNATITVQSTPVPTSTNLPSNSNAFVESDSEHPTTAQQPPEQFQMLMHSNSATPDPALTSARGTSEHLQASPQSPHEIRIVSPSEPSSTPAHPKRINGPHPLSAADLRMIYGDRIIEEEIDQGLRPKPLRTFSSEPPTPNVFDSNTSGVPSRSISPLTEALLSVAQRMSSQKTTETRKDSDFFQERFSPDYDELAHSFATLGLMSGRDDGRTGRYQVTVEEEEDIDAYRAAPKYSLPPPMTLARPPPPTISRASSFTDIRNAGSRSTNAWTTTPEDELFTDGYRTTFKQPLPLTSIPSTHSQPSKVSGTRSSTDARNTGRPFLAATPLRSNKPEKNGYLRAEPGWKRVPAPPSQVSQLSPLPLSLSPADRAANKSRDLWFPDPSYVPSPPINPGTLGPFAARQDYTKEDHSDKMPKMDSRDGAQGNKLSRQPSTNSLKAESITYNAGCSNKGKGKERVAPMPTYLSVDKFHNVNTGLWDEGEDHSQPISQQPTPYELYEILQRQTKERTSSSNVRNSSENFSPIPTRPRLSEPVVDSTKKPAESSYLHFVDPLPDIQDSPTFWPGQPDRNRNAKGNPHGSVRFANPPVEQFPGTSTSNGMQSSSRGFVQPLNATRLSHLTPMSEIELGPSVGHQASSSWGYQNNMPTSTSWGPSCENPLVSSPSSTFPSWNQQQLLAPLWRAPQGPGGPWENTYAGLPGNYRVLGPTGPNLQPGMTYEWPGNGWYSGSQPRNPWDMGSYMPPPSPMKLNKHPEFWMEGINDAVVWIRVGIVDYLLPARIFLRNSQFLRMTLRLHTQAGNPGPVVLNEVHNWEFECLLRVFYSGEDPSGQLTTAKQWEKVLEVMELWEFSSRFKEYAFSKLNPLLTAADRVHIGRTYSKPSWVRRGLVELCKRSSSLTVEECKKLGPEDTARVTEVQFARHFMIPQEWSEEELVRQVLERFDLEDFFIAGGDYY